MTTLVQPVGIGVGIENAFYATIKTLRPSKVIFVVTKRSLGRISDLVTVAEDYLSEADTEVVVLRNPENPVEIYKQLVADIRPEEDMVVDITLGTKAMAAALFLFAVRHGARVAYVSGTRDPHTGRVRTGTEEVRIFDTKSIAGLG